MKEIRNYRMIKVSYVPPTNNEGSMIKIWETRRYNDQSTQSKKFSYDYSVDNVKEQAVSILAENGFNVIGTASEFNNYVILCDNWGDDYKEIKDLK